MKTYDAKGFTLIELLTVVAIIAILAGLIMVVGPRMIENAKLRRLDGAMRQVSISLAAYYVDFSTYPPAYGFVGQENATNFNPPSDPAQEAKYYNLIPYMVRIKEDGNEDLYDEFALSYDTMNDGNLSLLEYSPRGRRMPDKKIEHDWTLPRYMGVNTADFSQEITWQLEAVKRPFIYIPVNAKQFQRVQKYWLDRGEEYAQRWEPSDPDFPQISFPPRNYDAFVLISVGPGGNTFGILPDPLGVPAEQANNGRDLYHILSLRAYYLATRDLNANGLLDFDFNARTKQGEGAATYEFAGKTITNNLPSPTMPAGTGPYIYVNK